MCSTPLPMFSLSLIFSYMATRRTSREAARLSPTEYTFPVWCARRAQIAFSALRELPLGSALHTSGFPRGRRRAFEITPCFRRCRIEQRTLAPCAADYAGCYLSTLSSSSTRCFIHRATLWLILKYPCLFFCWVTLYKYLSKYQTNLFYPQSLEPSKSPPATYQRIFKFKSPVCNIDRDLLAKKMK